MTHLSGRIGLATIACGYLASTLPIRELAYLLGFSDTTGFH